MKKKFLAMALMMSMVLGLCACGATEDNNTAPLQTVAAQPIATEAPAADAGSEPTTETPAEENTDTDVTSTIKAITERVEKDGKIQSYLTGEWKDVAVATRRPMAVMVANNNHALPQYGISASSIIYEAPMEKGSCTRLMCVIEDYDDLDHIGPVRSSRLYFLKESMSLDAIYCNWGLAVPYVADTINLESVNNVSAAVSGIKVSSDEAFGRDKARQQAGYATEYTGIMTISGYNKALTRHNYETSYRMDRYEQGYQFADDVYLDYADVELTATKFSPGGYGSGGGGYTHANPYFVYDPATKLYTRYQFGGEHKDEMNNETLTCTNVIFKITTGGYLDDNGYLSLNNRESGPAYIFTAGKLLTANWVSSADENAATHYYGADGNEIVLNQGKTWVCLIWSDYQDLITIE